MLLRRRAYQTYYRPLSRLPEPDRHANHERIIGAARLHIIEDLRIARSYGKRYPVVEVAAVCCGSTQKIGYAYARTAHAILGGTPITASPRPANNPSQPSVVIHRTSRTHNNAPKRGQ